MKQIAVTATSLSTDLRRVPELARQVGVRGVLYDLNLLPELSQTGRREFRHLVSAVNREIAGLAIDLGHDGLSPRADIDRQLSRLEKAMDAARGLQSPLVCVDVGPLPTPAIAETPKPKVTPDMAGLLILPTPADLVPAVVEPAQTPADVAMITHLDAVMIELGHRADRFGVVLAFRSDLASLAALERTVQAAGCPWFGVDFDPVAVLRDGVDLDSVFSRFSGLIRHVRARDAVAGSGGRTKPAAVGQGQVNWPHVLANLEAAAYQGWITIDPIELPDRLAAVRRAVSALSDPVP